jgi:hypothetical protein
MEDKIMDKSMLILEILISLAILLVPTTLCIVGEVGIGLVMYFIVFIAIIALIIDELTD